MANPLSATIAEDVGVGIFCDYYLVWSLLATKGLDDFLRQQARERGVSLRRLSREAGLSPGTVQNIIQRKYQPSIFSLNKLADYLGVKREYVWQLAGLLEDMEYGPDAGISDPQLRFHFSRVDKLPKEAKTLVINLIEAVILYLEKSSK